MSGKEIFEEDSSTKKPRPKSKFDLNSVTYLNRSNSESEARDTDLRKESVNYIMSTSTLKRSGNQEKEEQNKTSIMNQQDVQKKGTQKIDSPNSKKPKRHLKINLDLLVRKTSQDSVNLKSVTVKSPNPKTQMHSSKNNCMARSKSYNGPNSKKQKHPKNKKFGKTASHFHSNLENVEKTQLKVKLNSLLGKFERYKKKMNNLDSKRELKKILRSQSTPGDQERVLTFGKKEITGKPPKANPESMANFSFKKTHKKRTFNEKRRTTFAKKVQRKKNTLYKTSNHLKFQKIFSVYRKNKKKSKKPKKRYTKQFTPKTKELVQRSSLNKIKLDKADDNPYFSSRNIFGFNNCSERGISSENVSKTSHSFNLNPLLGGNKTIHLGKVFWRDGSSGSNSNNKTSNLSNVRPSELSETGSSMFIPTVQEVTQKESFKKGSKETSNYKLFKTNANSKRVNVSASKSMRFLKNFKAVLKRTKF